ncbi:MAG: hypothetical protein IT174_03070 [Acidobacteria bacterium]|nr:hypothetical protein [Acidobacteriota bacterium]
MPSLIPIACFVAAWFLIEYLFVNQLAIAFVPLFVGGFVVWWFTTRRGQVDPNRIIVPYLLTVILFILHVYEEYHSAYLGYRDIMHGAPLDTSLQQMTIFAASLAPILWLLGAVMMVARWNVGYFVVSTFLFGMMFIEPYHFIAPFIPAGGFQYVGGLFTAGPLVALGWYTFFRVRSELRAETS